MGNAYVIFIVFKLKFSFNAIVSYEFKHFSNRS